MKSQWMIAAVLVAGGTAVSVSAGNPSSFRGSDTLFDFTAAMMSNCPGVTAGGASGGSCDPRFPGCYQGTGTGNGQSAMLFGTQQVAPMSSFLNNGACTGMAAQSEGLVIGLDGVSIVASKDTFASQACNGVANVNCQPTTKNGAVFDSTNTSITLSNFPGAVCSPACRAGQLCSDLNTCIPSTYQFTGWRDVLRILLAGFDHNNISTGAPGWAARDCNSNVRNAIVANYGSFFETPCSAQGGEISTAVCTSIRHIFRLDDFSGTSDTMVSLLNLPSIVYPNTLVLVFPGGFPTGLIQQTGATPFCNAVRPGFVFPQSAAGLCDDATACTVGGAACDDASACIAVAPEPTCLQGWDATRDPTSAVVVPACAGQLGPARENGVYDSTMQDNDPIRRTCVGNALTVALGAPAEDVCSHSGDLGVVLPLNDQPELHDLAPNPPTQPLPTSDPLRYNAAECVKGNLSTTTPPVVYDAITQTKLICNGTIKRALCPNGDVCTNLGACLIPADANNNPQCLASKLSAPAITQSAVAVPVIHPVLPSIAEGRAYNQHLFVLNVSQNVGQPTSNGFSTPLQMTGAYYRIHTNHIINAATNPITGPNPHTCQFPDMTDQMGCLVYASPCSIGYASRSATNFNGATTDVVKVNNQLPQTVCIQGDGAGIAGLTYPLSRKLYLNTVSGFAAVTASELLLAKCETDLAQTADGIPAGLVTTNPATSLPTWGLVNLPIGVNGGEPYCEDFNENMLCGSATFPTNNNACSTPPPSFGGDTTVTPNKPGFPAASTVCGNGAKEAYEDCDCGTVTVPGQDAVGCSDPTTHVATVNGGSVCSTTCRNQR